ncbi:hypothetical protein [Paraburkholderia sp. SG-MS1]|nr:hypothetical protein [Paraburkholderia sp. SG-MS1]
MTVRLARYTDSEAFPTLTLTLGEQARAEAIRRGGEWKTHAAHTPLSQ